MDSEGLPQVNPLPHKLTRLKREEFEAARSLLIRLLDKSQSTAQQSSDPLD